jgi:methylglutaconyl-CoA hydratase
MSEKLYLKNVDKRGVALITLNRPEIHNAFNDQLINELTECFNAMEADDTIRLVVLTGEGKSFCAGADLNWMKSMKDYSNEKNLEDSQRLDGLFKTMNRFKKPIIGKVNGAALGGGAGLISVCDFVIASTKAKIGFTETKLGLIPSVISPYVIAKIGESHARANFLCGRRFSATKAFQMGLVHEVTDRDSLDSECDQIVDEFLSAAPIASQLAKHLVNKVVELQKGANADVSVFTTTFISDVRTSDEGQEGMTALLEKRKPRWNV